jgi:hypothetical protein
VESKKLAPESEDTQMHKNPPGVRRHAATQVLARWEGRVGEAGPRSEDTWRHGSPPRNVTLESPPHGRAEKENLAPGFGDMRKHGAHLGSGDM